MKKKMILLIIFLLLLVAIPFVSYLITPPKGVEEKTAAAVARISGAAGPSVDAASVSATESAPASDGNISATESETAAIALTDTLQTLAEGKSVTVEQATIDKTPTETKAKPALVVKETDFRLYDDSLEKTIKVSNADFLIGTLACELSPDSSGEALKAQAVAAYTYYSKLRREQRANPTDEHGADFSVNTKVWLYYTTKEEMKTVWGKKFNSYYKKLQKAVRAVEGQTLQYNGDLITASFYAISSGQTENSEDIWGGACPYLTAVASPWDQYADGYKTTKTVTAAEFQKTMTGAYNGCKLSGDAGQWIGEITRTDSGSVQTIQVGNQTLAGVEMRTLFGLRSSNFTVKYKNGSFHFTVLGYGHGVGMSQNGAVAMAEQGYTYDKILSWYYPGAELMV